MARPADDSSDGAALSREDFRAVADLFGAACALAPESRVAFVHERTADARVRREVLALLASSEREDGFLEPPAAPPELVATAEQDPMVGRRVAGYTIVRRIAAGGMGVVYEAAQESPRRIVAVKLIRPDLVSAETLHRFRQEAEILGRLQHPGIAAIHEAGAFVVDDDPRGRPRPFCAMEFVDGIPIDRWTDERGLDVEARLALLAQVCDAVDHAHRRGVIHRDLKSGNILVTPAGAPKVLDFGIARAVDVERSATQRTSVGHIVGTLGSMSPEQLRGDPDAVDFRSDIYSLGVLAYELLGGRSPFDLSQRGVPASIRHLMESEPTSLGTLRRDLRGDISTIVAKAMAKEPERRYDSAAAFASDLRACREHRPVLARPPSRTYLMRKFVRRNRTAVVGVVAAFVLLVVAAAGTTVGWRRAEAAATRSRRVNTYLTELLAGFDPNKVGSSNIPLEKALDEAGEKIGPLLEGEPETAIDVHRVLGERYAALGLWTQAERHFRGVLELVGERFGEESLECAEVLGSIARMQKEQDHTGQAQRLFERALAIQQARLPRGDLRIGETLNDLAVAYVASGDFAAAEPLQREALAIARSHPEISRQNLATAIDNFASTLFMNGKLEEAAAAIEEAAQIRETLGRFDLEDAQHLSAGAQILMHIPQHAERAEAMLREAYRIRAKLLAANHPKLADSRFSLARLLLFTDRKPEAIEVLREWLANRPDSEDMTQELRVLRMLADAQRSVGDASGAAETEARLEAATRSAP
ncbi:MAG: serine/threonine-protein kinase [Phycisphaerales bacterium]